MINFMPKIYKGELLTSILRRYHRDSGNYAFETTYTEVFGEDINYSHSLLPTNIDKLVSNIPKRFNITSNDLIENNTLYNYYTAFTSKERKDEIREKMKKGEDYLYRIIKFKEIPMNQYLRYCPKCLQEQLEARGEFHWHRAHQISYICTEHGEILKDSEYKLENKQLSYHIPQNNISDTQELDTDSLTKLFNISKRIERLIDKSSDITEEELQTVYMTMFDRLGFLYRSKTQIYLQELIKQMKQYYSQDLLSIIIKKDNDKWIKQVTEKHKAEVHPLYHILMQVFLGVDDEEIEGIINKMRLSRRELIQRGFFVDDVDAHLLGYYKEIADLKVTCKNPLAKHYRTKEIKGLRIEYNYAKQELNCICTCECGFIYKSTYSHLIKSDGQAVDYVVEWGEVYYQELAKISYLGAAEISRRTGLGQSAIKNHFRKIGKYKR